MKVRVVICVIVALVMIVRTPSAAAQPCPIGQVCDATIPQQRLPLIDMQQTVVWCWAASAQAAFRYYGYEVPQQVIVGNVVGAPVITTANAHMMVSMLNRTYVDVHGRRFLVRTPRIYDTFSWLSANPMFMKQIGATPLNNYGIRDALRTGHPIMYGTANHAMLLVSMLYQEGPAGVWPVGGWVLDPAPGGYPPRAMGLRRLMPPEMTAFFGAEIVVTPQ